MSLSNFRVSLSRFMEGVKMAYADDGRIGPNDAPALRELAAKTHVPGLSRLVDLFASSDLPLAPHAARRGSGYAVKVLDFKPGVGAGFNANKLEATLGRPEGTGDQSGSLDVVSLGQGGQLTLELGRAVTRGLKVFENPFGADGKAVNPQPTKVEVYLEKEQRWVELKGDAGLKPVYANSENGISLRTHAAGGDEFLFKDSGITAGTAITRVRLTDRGTASVGPVGGGTAGADIDAVYGF
jgi:hypothetical protein